MSFLVKTMSDKNTWIAVSARLYLWLISWMLITGGLMPDIRSERAWVVTVGIVLLIFSDRVFKHGTRCLLRTWIYSSLISIAIVALASCLHDFVKSIFIGGMLCLHTLAITSEYEREMT